MYPQTNFNAEVPRGETPFSRCKSVVSSPTPVLRCGWHPECPDAASPQYGCPSLTFAGPLLGSRRLHVAQDSRTIVNRLSQARVPSLAETPRGFRVAQPHATCHQRAQPFPTDTDDEELPLPFPRGGRGHPGLHSLRVPLPLPWWARGPDTVSPSVHNLSSISSLWTLLNVTDTFKVT